MDLMHKMQTVVSLTATWDFPDRHLAADVEQGPCINRAFFPSDSWEGFWLSGLICMASHLLSFIFAFRTPVYLKSPK